MASGRRLRAVDELLETAVKKTIADLDLDPVDAAAVKLAKQYATAIDAAPAEERAETLEKLGPKLLAALESLGATPAARARLRGGATGAAAGRLQLLREARRAN